MSATAQLRQDEPTAESPDVPDDLGSANAKLVYLYLNVAGEAGVAEMSADLGMPKISLFGVLDSLSASDHVEARDGAYALAE